MDRTPEAEAVCASDARVTYCELDRRANRLARHLVAAGVEVGDIVGVCLERTPEMIVALLAVLKAGAAYVPLDPAYPKDRIGFMLQDAGARVVVMQLSVEHLFAEANAVRVMVDRDCVAIASHAESRMEKAVRSDHLAYVIYTSGSTGKPKGVQIEHRNAAAFIAWSASVFDDSQIAGMLAGTSICFDLSIFEIFFPLACGGRVILAENTLALIELPARNEVTLVNTVPSVAAELIRLGAIPANVATVNLAGEPLSTSLVNAMYATGTVKRVYDLYGPTEDTTYSTFTLRLRDQPPTIGRPIANGRVYLLDQQMNPVPIGVAGEIYLGGAGVARGYLNRPELTAERFLADPFQPARDARLYRTGDLARYRSDGNIEYLSRIDNQVKIRGFRIELGEIEVAINTHPAVRQCAVITREDTPGDKQLVAYVVAVGDADGLVDRLAAALTAQLPPYMVPAHFVVLPALPLNANGKLDRKALPPPNQSRVFAAHDLVVPRTQTEEAVAAIWRQVLRSDAIDCAEDFFRLGGHSLLAAQVVSRLRDVFQIELPLPMLFHHRTVQALASYVDAALREQRSARRCRRSSRGARRDRSGCHSRRSGCG